MRAHGFTSRHRSILEQSIARGTFVWIPALVMMLQISACGKTAPAPTAQTPTGLGTNLTQCSESMDDQNLPPQTLETRIWNASHGSLTCNSNEDCNPAVAMVSVVVKKTIERCTGFLIAPDLLVTNDHCVSSSTAVTEYGGSCDNLIFAHFADAGAGTQAQSVSCKRIVVRSNQCGLGSKDYAVIQLEHPITDRQPLRISARGFGDHESASIYRVQMRNALSSGVATGVLVKSNCSASYNTMVYPAMQSSQSPLMTFGDCPIQKGNSGSPALNEDGEVGAIIQGYLEPPEDNKLRDQLQALLLDQGYGEVGLGTQLYCAPELSRSRIACTAVAPIYTLFPKAYAAQVGDFNPRLLPAVGTNERWKPLVAPSANQKLFLRTPICVSPSRSASFQSTVMSYKRGINRELRAEWRSAYRSGQKTVVFESTASDGSGMITFKNDEFGSVTIPACSRFTQR